MPDENRDFALLWDMRKAARDVVRFTQGITYEQFLADEIKRLACERQIAVVGEAASRVSKEFREAHPEIPWRDIVAQRHILVHDYSDIDYSKIWKVATVHVPHLLPQLDALIPPPPPDPEA